MVTPIGIIGVILAFILMNVLIYKGLNAVITAMIVTVLVIVTSGMDFNETFTSGLSFVGLMCGNFMPVFVFGGILAAIYNATNATASLGKLIMRPFSKSEDLRVKIVGTLSMLVLIRVVIGLAGLDNIAIMPFMIALVVAVFAGCDIPRKYVNGMLIFAGTIGTLIPGVPHQYVLIYQYVVPQFNNNGNLVVRWLLLIVYIIAALWVFWRCISKDVKQGKHFEAGPLDVPDYSQEIKGPHWILTFIPVLLVYVTYNFLGLNAWQSLAVACILAIILFYPYFPRAEGKKLRIRAIMESVNTGTFTVPLILSAAMLASQALSASPSFNAICDAFAKIPIPVAFSFMLAAILLTGMTGGAQAALVIVGGLALSRFTGLSVQAAGIMALWSTSVLDTLPNNLGIIMQSELTATPMEECYPTIFKTTVILTLIMCVITTVLAAVGAFG